MFLINFIGDGIRVAILNDLPKNCSLAVKQQSHSLTMTRSQPHNISINSDRN